MIEGISFECSHEDDGHRAGKQRRNNSRNGGETLSVPSPVVAWLNPASQHEHGRRMQPERGFSLIAVVVSRFLVRPTIARRATPRHSNQTCGPYWQDAIVEQSIRRPYRATPIVESYSSKLIGELLVSRENTLSIVPADIEDCPRRCEVHQTFRMPIGPRPPRRFTRGSQSSRRWMNYRTTHNGDTLQGIASRITFSSAGSPNRLRQLS